MLVPKGVKYVIGVDEVGRGPLAGPVAVAAVCVAVNEWQKLPRVKDSKALTAKAREAWCVELKKWQKSKTCQCAHAFKSAQVIDSKGISYAITSALAEVLKKINKKPGECLVLLDGGLKAPREYCHQQTIIKGDTKETVIALASIWAKVHRDAHLMVLAKRHPGYGLEQHKGYGTKAHYLALRRLGPATIHRLSFLKRFKS